jgi:hypothetical protein
MLCCASDVEISGLEKKEDGRCLWVMTSMEELDNSCDEDRGSFRVQMSVQKGRAVHPNSGEQSHFWRRRKFLTRLNTLLLKSDYAVEVVKMQRCSQMIGTCHAAVEKSLHHKLVSRSETSINSIISGM